MFVNVAANIGINGSSFARRHVLLTMLWNFWLREFPFIKIYFDITTIVGDYDYTLHSNGVTATHKCTHLYVITYLPSIASTWNETRQTENVKWNRAALNNVRSYHSFIVSSWNICNFVMWRIFKFIWQRVLSARGPYSSILAHGSRMQRWCKVIMSVCPEVVSLFKTHLTFRI